MTRKPLDQSTIRKIRALRAEGVSWYAAANRLRLGYWKVRAALDPDYVERDRSRGRERHRSKGAAGAGDGKRKADRPEAAPRRSPAPVTLPRLSCLEKPFPPEHWGEE